jgi:polyisoprenoid-binding protein YceI
VTLRETSEAAMRKRIFLIGAMAATPALLAAATIASTLSFQSGSRVWVEGTSSTRSYRCESPRVDGTAQATTIDLTQLRSVTGAQLTIPVASLDCRNGTMNGHMRRALKSDEHTNIRFQATSVALTPGGNGSAARMTGNLTIAGETRPATLQGTVVEENGQLRVRGSHNLTMTDFGVQPPSLMMGTMKVHAPVTIGYDVLLRQ